MLWKVTVKLVDKFNTKQPDDSFEESRHGRISWGQWQFIWNKEKKGTDTSIHRGPDSPTAKSSVMTDGAGFDNDWYAEHAFTISCICKKWATDSTSSTFCRFKVSFAVYIKSRTWPKPETTFIKTTHPVRQQRRGRDRVEHITWRGQTCCIANVQMYHILLVQKEGAEVHAAGSQHSLVGLEVHTVHDKGAVTQQALLALPVKLLQNFPTVPRELHRPEGQALWIKRMKCGARGSLKRLWWSG